MVAPVGSLSELETGGDTETGPHQRLLHKKFNYLAQSISSTATAPKSREETEEMSASEESQPIANPPEAEPSPSLDGRVIKSPLLRAASPVSPDGEKERESMSSPLPLSITRDKPAYLIRWNRFEEQVCNAFAELFCSDHFVDVTLACDGEMMKAHKIVLAMSSPFFRRIFQETPCKHPVVIIKGMTPKTLRSVLQYIYLGEVTLNKSEINNFMDAADYLSICGVFANLYSCDISTTRVQDEGRSQEENENEMEQDFDKPISDREQDQERERTASESEYGGGPSTFRDDSQSEQEESIASQSHSNVIKYHGIKSRWTRRYSNNSYHGTPTASSPVEVDHKRSASAGEVETIKEQGRSASVGTVVVPNVEERESMVIKGPETISSTNNREMEVSTPIGEEERIDRMDERACVSDDPDSSRERRIIQRAFPKYYGSVYEEGSDHSMEESRSLPPSYAQPVHSSQSMSRSSRGMPYSLGAKDFSHPLQVSVDPHPQPPSLYGGPSSSSLSGGKVESAVRVKSHSGFTLYSTPHSHPTQRMYRTQSETEFSIAPSPVSLLPSHHQREERGGGVVVKTSPQPPYRQHHHHPTSSHPQQHSSHQQHHHSVSDHHSQSSRPHLSLLSTQSPWSIPEHQRSRPSQHHHHHTLEDSPRDMDDFRYRSDSLERDFSNFGRAKEFFSHASQLRGVPGFTPKSHSYPPATDLSVSSLSQQYSLGFIPQLKSPPSSSSSAATRPKTKAIRSSQVPQSARYTAAEVDQMVDAVANYPGNIVPCTLCQKFVKRERLRAHIHECHLLSGEKIICPHCGIALKSKGSFRVHIWRHKRGALPTRNTMTDFGRDRPPAQLHTK